MPPLFHTQAQLDEYNSAMEQESMSDGEFMAMALREYAGTHGADNDQHEWILSPFDSWEKNPHYTGKPGPHPESDYGESHNGEFLIEESFDDQDIPF